MELNNSILFFCLLEKVLVVLHRLAWLSSKSTYGIPDNWTYFFELAMHVMNSYLVYWLLFPAVISSGILSSFHKNCFSVSFIGIDQCSRSGQFERSYTELRWSWIYTSKRHHHGRDRSHVAHCMLCCRGCHLPGFPWVRSLPGAITCPILFLHDLHGEFRGVLAR